MTGKGSAFIHALFLFMLGVSVNVLAQETTVDSVFNGLDYFYGRIVEGFGVGIGQFVGPKYESYQYFRTSPFFYMGFKKAPNRFDISVNADYGVHRFEDADKGQYTDFPDIGSFDYAIRYRPIPSLQLGFSESYSSSGMPDIREYNRTANALSVLYISKAGEIFPTPGQLVWMHYLDLRPDSSGQSHIAFLSRGQFQAHAGMSYNDPQKEDGHADFMYQPADDSAIRDYRWTLGFSYAADDDMLVGSRINIMPPSGMKISEDDISFKHVVAVKSIMNQYDTHSWESESWMNILHTEKFMHRFALNLRNQKTTQYYLNYALDGKSYHKSRFEFDEWMLRSTYAVGFLRNVSPPSRETYLANWNGFFGNRLPAKGLLILGEIFYQRHWGASEYHAQADAQIFFPNAKLNSTHALNVEFQTRYGLGDWIEGRALLRYNQVFINDVFGSRGTGLWSKQFSLHFGTFRYSEEYRQQYGWNHLSRFDRLYGPSLRPGMMTGSLGYREYCRPDDISGVMNPSLRIIHLCFDAGIVKNVELKFDTNLYKETASFDFEQKPWYGNLMASIVWRPYKILRMTVAYSNDKRSNESMVSFIEMPSWRIELVSMF